MANSPEQTVHDLGHLAFCALVVLKTAVQDGVATSPMAEHLFLVRWLATAQKQKRFPRSVAIDIQLLLDKGRKQGLGANLITRVEYLWQTCTGDLRQQNDLFRLTYAIETLKVQGWGNELVTQAEWDDSIVKGLRLRCMSSSRHLTHLTTVIPVTSAVTSGDTIRSMVLNDRGLNILTAIPRRISSSTVRL